MLNDKVEIEVYGRKLLVEMEGLTHFDIHTLAQTVSERMTEIARESKVVDSSKLAILTAMEIAAENQRMRTQLEGLAAVEERKLDGMLLALEKAVESSGEKT